MLKIIIIECIACLLVIGFCNKANADSIPGFLEFEVNTKYWLGLGNRDTYYNTELKFKYGGTFGYFKSYLFGETQTFFVRGDMFYENFPFRDVYTYGLGLQINEVFYIEAGHTCSHYVRSKNEYIDYYDNMTKIGHNHIKAGIKIKID